LWRDPWKREEGRVENKSKEEKIEIEIEEKR